MSRFSHFLFGGQICWFLGVIWSISIYDIRSCRVPYGFRVPADGDLFLGAKLLSGSPFHASFSLMTGGAGGVESAVFHNF
jgi:hypothetical protein